MRSRYLSRDKIPNLLSNFTWKYLIHASMVFLSLPLTPSSSALYYFTFEHMRTSPKLCSALRGLLLVTATKYVAGPISSGFVSHERILLLFYNWNIGLL